MITFTQNEGEAYLKINGLEHRVLTSRVSDFTNEDKPVVYFLPPDIRKFTPSNPVSSFLNSVYESGTFKKMAFSLVNGSELITLDPASPYLKETYERLKTTMKKELGPQPTVQSILDYTIGAVRKLLLPDEQLKDKVVTEKKKDPETQKFYHGLPIIPIDAFIQGNAGVCKHHALFVCYLLDKMIKENILPEGSVFFHADTIASGAGHAWPIYKPVQANATHDNYDFYLVDSLNYDEAFKVMDKESRHYDDLRSYFGQAVITDLENRHNRSDLESVAYTKIKNKILQEDFIYTLLDASTEQCRKFLNHQYNLGACKDILKALKTDEYYYKHKNYKYLVKDVERVLNTNYLHNQNYDGIKKPNDRQQFVLALLCESTIDRNEILARQHIEDLKALQKSLETEGRERKDLYQQFETYQTVMNEINKFIALKVIDVIKAIVSSGQLEQHPERWTPRSFAPQAGKSAAQRINSIINEAELKSANLEDVMNLLDKIKESAKKSAENPHGEQTKAFLDILKKEKVTLTTLLRDLAQFQQGASPGVTFKMR